MTPEEAAREIADILYTEYLLSDDGDDATAAYRLHSAFEKFADLLSKTL